MYYIYINMKNVYIYIFIYANIFVGRQHIDT
jgi:hypothetical protein